MGRFINIFHKNVDQHFLKMLQHFSGKKSTFFLFFHLRPFFPDRFLHLHLRPVAAAASSASLGAMWPSSPAAGVGVLDRQPTKGSTRSR
jgi:hypothetical protein